MIPIADDDSDRTLRPAINWLLIAANIFAFVFLQGLGSNQRFTYAFATVPAEIAAGHGLSGTVVIRDPITGETAGTIELEPPPVAVYWTLLTSLFLHGGLGHLLGNMLYLYIFGDNVEDALGHGRYLLFYLTCGVLASLSHVVATFVTGGNPYLPSLGASGAISGVLAAYISLFPAKRVRVLVFLFVMDVPAVVAIGLWFAFQLFSGIGMLGGGSQAGGVAYAAHIGGFAAGLLLVRTFRKRPAHGDRRPIPY
jgi:membrane associated rhomboid family serine protease